MRTTDAMREVLARPIAKVPALRGRNVTILFYEASTRTRVSFEVAAKNLSADVVNIAAATSSVTKGESLVDTVRTVEALGAQMLVMRHSVSGAPYLAAEIFGGSVLNGGDGWHAHPTQALLDLYTMRSRLPGGSVAGRKVVILGDVLHSRVARSNIWSLTAAGADLWLCGPPTLLRGFEAWAGAGAAAGRRFHVTASVDEALRDADVVMALRIQRERMASGLLPSLREYAARYGLTAERLALARPGALVMHPGPMNEGVEIAADVAAGVAVGHHGPGDERRRGPDGAALPAGRGAPGWPPAPPTATAARHMTDLDIGRAWLVDPAAGREGPGEIVVEDGILDGRDLARAATRPTASMPGASSWRPGSSTFTRISASPATRMPRRWRRAWRRPRTAGSRRSAPCRTRRRPSTSPVCWRGSVRPRLRPVRRSSCSRTAR